jgi:hypothetical protein
MGQAILPAAALLPDQEWDRENTREYISPDIREAFQ